MKNYKILLTTANARYSHTSFGLRWLYANLKEFKTRAFILEFEINRKPSDVIAKIIETNPDILAVGVYIWNISFLTTIISEIKQKKPEMIIVLGGPELWFEQDTAQITKLADYIITGEGEFAFYNLVKMLMAGNKPPEKIIKGDYLDVQTLESPYELYTDEDVKHRVIYVESSRGCPFSCEFCLSSLSGGVRKFDLDKFLKDMTLLINKGVKLFKFVDRTFNLEKKRVFAILDFFLEHFKEGMQLHFEIVPDLLTEELLDKIRQFPKVGLHLEAGIQSLNQDALKAISRRQDNAKALANINKIVTTTGALVHADLVAGLPYEDFASFAKGFDLLFAAKPHHIQVGILKRLKGVPIIRHQKDCDLVFAKLEPYEIIKTNLMSEAEINTIKIFARFFDVYVNSEKFSNAAPLLILNEPSPFLAFNRFFEYVYQKTGRTYAIDLIDKTEMLYDYLVKIKREDATLVEEAVAKDFYSVKGRNEKLSFMV